MVPAVFDVEVRTGIHFGLDKVHMLQHEHEKSLVSRRNHESARATSMFRCSSDVFHVRIRGRQGSSRWAGLGSDRGWTD